MSVLRRSSRTPTLVDMPPEILLEIIPQIPYEPTDFLALNLIQKEWHSLLSRHEQSIVLAIRTQQYSSTTLSLFPSLPHSWRGLSTLHKRLQTLADVHKHWLKITHNGPELHWLRDRWESAHKAGMLLLYRLCDVETYAGKVEIIQGLPSASLACLMFKLYSSIKILRLYGPEPINLTYAAGNLLARSDVELAFEEMLLTHGPEFFVILLNSGRPEVQQREWAVEVLKREIAGMDERQLPLADGTSQPPTLTSVLRRHFASSIDCHVSETPSKMWEVLSGTIFDCVDEKMMVAIVNGEPLAKKADDFKVSTWHMAEGRCCGY